MKQVLILLTIALAVHNGMYAQYENTKIKIGTVAPELKLINPANDTLRLSDLYKKRIILLDFWASWCGPCRRANPRLVALYAKYNGKKIRGAKKGLEIVSVSLDREKDPWIKAIAKDSLYWPYHMSDLGGWNSVAAKEYGTNYIPQAFLIGSDGMVIAKYNTAEQAEADIERLLKEGYKRKANKGEEKKDN